MDFIFELIFELIFEGSIEVSSNKKVPKIIRHTLIFFIVLFFCFVIFGLFIVGLYLWNKNIYAGILIMSVSVIMLIASVCKFKKFKDK